MLLIKFKSLFELQICTTDCVEGEQDAVGFSETKLIGLFDVYIRFLFSTRRFEFIVCQ